MQFSTYRIWLLIKKQWAENRQLYLLGLLATAGVMGIAFLFHSSENQGLDYNAQRAVLMAGAGIGGAIFTSTILSRFNDKLKGIQALTLPASALEKLVTAIIYSQVIFPVAYVLAVYPVMALVHYVDTDIVGRVNRLYDLQLDDKLVESFLLYFILQAVILLCSVLFKRYTIIKTTVLIIVVFYGALSLNPIIAGRMLKTEGMEFNRINLKEIVYDEAGQRVVDTVVKESIVLPRLTNAFPYSDIKLYNDNFSYHIRLGLNDPHYVEFVLAQKDAVKLLFTVLAFLCIPFLWLITWFRLKETQL
jgi:hypothetical protein